MRIEVMDTTLRDGEQTSGMSFKSNEKLHIARHLLEEVKVDRLEIASARISEGEYDAVEKIMVWAKENGYLDKIEVLGFVDGTASLDWINKAGCKYINLLSKGSLKHVTKQLKKEPEEHFKDIKASITYATKLGINVNIYLEDWSNGIKNSPEYVYAYMEALKDEPIKRFMLPDTLGILNPDEVAIFFKDMTTRYPDLHFDFHAHNDYDFAVANTFSAIKSGAHGIHTTVNGLGERTGNAPLASIIACIKDHLKDIETNVKEENLNKISRLVEVYSGVRIPNNKPIVGEHVFTQTCGVHADGDQKDNLYFNDLLPERFGRTREYALGKTSGNASILNNIQELGLELSKEDIKKVTQRVVELGDRKEYITKEDLPYIISDVLGSTAINDTVKLINYHTSHAQHLQPTATIALEIDGETYKEIATGHGQYDAFVKAVRKIYKSLKIKLPTLSNYAVTIPPGGRTDALVQSIITWSSSSKDFKTKGLDPDQQVAAIKATIKMLNIVANEKK